jgi:hypothetical protein
MAPQPLTPGETPEYVGIKMPAADNSWLIQIAEAAGISKSELVRRIIQERRRREQPPP